MTATATESKYFNYNYIASEEPIRIIKIFFASARRKNASFLAEQAVSNRHERHHLNSPARKARDLESTYNAPTIIE